MIPAAVRSALSGLLLVIVAASCAGTISPRTAPAPASVADELSPAEMEALYLARIDSARMRFTEADVRFMTAMIGHHAQAIVMARLAPTHGASQSV
ncbi:MAG TPA: DUF305 domain-containing protein, partial [Gemmatimonadaceae bacterium]|nr:DUF305 domain-containing protein [Gemmatimonadaceae bacterium]